MARDARGWYIYEADNHGSEFPFYSCAMLIPIDTAGETQRGWVAAGGGENTLPKRMTPRHVVGRDSSGNQARAIVATTGAQLWDGTINSFTVNGVTYTVTGFVGESRTAVAP